MSKKKGKRRQRPDAKDKETEIVGTSVSCGKPRGLSCEYSSDVNLGPVDRPVSSFYRSSIGN